MKFKHIYLVLFPAVVLLLFISAFKGTVSQDMPGHNDKILKFSHKFHTEMDVDCQTCHSKVIESTKLSDRLLPDHETCGSCHDMEDENNCTTCHYEDINEPLIQKTPPDIYFNHSLHVDKNKIECQACHIGIIDVDYAFQ